MTGEAGSIVGGRYRLIGPIGPGGVGRAWRAMDETLGREVAIKEIALPPGLSEDGHRRHIARMEQEARAAGRLNDPHVVAVHGLVIQDGVPWIVMELVAGESLDSLLRRTGPLPWAQVAEIGAQIASALAYAHERQIVHGDLKPDNVLLAGTGVVLADFGIARAMDETARRTSDGALIGTPHSMSPEQVQNHDIGPASDLWSLGVLLYAAVEGRLPFTGPPAYPLADAILNQFAPPPSQAGPLTPLIWQLLSNGAAQRPTAAPQPGPHPGYHGPPIGWQPGCGPGPYLPPQQTMNGPGGGMMPGHVRLAEWGEGIAATVSTIKADIDEAAAMADGTTSPTAAGRAALWIGMGYAVVFWLWQLYRQGKTGQTIGKRVVRIRVVREADGHSTGFGLALVRAFAHALDGLPLYIGYFAPLWDAKNQTFADKACQTVVIQDQ